MLFFRVSDIKYNKMETLRYLSGLLGRYVQYSYIYRRSIYEEIIIYIYIYEKYMKSNICEITQTF